MRAGVAASAGADGGGKAGDARGGDAPLPQLLRDVALGLVSFTPGGIAAEARRRMEEALAQGGAGKTAAGGAAPGQPASKRPRPAEGADAGAAVTAAGAAANAPQGANGGL